tara:strand:+ start:22134 stop:23606 length:1473 start_codon:yes stop_codon:yes gene_type:complete
LFACNDSEKRSSPPEIVILNTLFEFDSLDKVTLAVEVSSENSIDLIDWELTSGQSIEFVSDNSSLSFVAPIVSQTTELVFSLTVLDNKGLEATENIVLKVYPPTSSIGVYSHLLAFDLDNDQLDDIIMSESALLVWYKNQGGGVFSRKKVISDFSENITNLYISNNPETEITEIFISTANQYFRIDYQGNSFPEPITISLNWQTDDSSICLGSDAILEDVTKDGISDVVWSADCHVENEFINQFAKVVFIARGLNDNEYSHPEIVQFYTHGGHNLNSTLYDFIISDLNNDSFKELVTYSGNYGAGVDIRHALVQVDFALGKAKFNLLHSVNFGYYKDENGDNVYKHPGLNHDGVYLPALQFIDINNDSKLDVLESGTISGERYQKIIQSNGNEYIDNNYDSFPLLFNHIRDLNNDGNKDLILIGERNSLGDNLVSVISWQESSGLAYDGLKDIHVANELYEKVLIGNIDANNIIDFLAVTSTGELKPILR